MSALAIVLVAIAAVIIVTGGFVLFMLLAAFGKLLKEFWSNF